MPTKAPGGERALRVARETIQKLQKEGLSLEQIQAEMAQKGISPETTTKMMKEIKAERVWNGFTLGLLSLVFGLVFAGFTIGTWLGWFEFDFLSERRVIILIMGFMLGVVLILIGIGALIETLIEASKRS